MPFNPHNISLAPRSAKNMAGKRISRLGRFLLPLPETLYFTGISTAFKNKNPDLRFRFFNITFVILFFFLSNVWELGMGCFAQLQVVNNGLPISVNAAKIIIKGNVAHQNNGSIVNSGNIYVTGDWTNNNSTNNIFTIGPDGWVHLTGTSQTIGGTRFTYFNNLELAGTGKKQLGAVDTEVEDTLALNDREFAAGSHTVFVKSAFTGSVTRANTMLGGFISSTNNGGLSRNTLSANSYLFPVGSSDGTSRYRPVEIAPNTSSANTFKVRMANVNPTNDGYNITSKDDSIYDVNTNYYHRIFQTNGTDATTLRIYYDAIADGSFQTIAHWQGTPRWENTKNNIALSGSPLSSLSVQGWKDFSTPPFALAKRVVEANSIMPNIFSPNGDGINDVLYLRGKGIEEMILIIYDRWGEQVFESTELNHGWDGNYKEKPMNTAVFVYTLYVKYITGEKVNKYGNITLIR